MSAFSIVAPLLVVPTVTDEAEGIFGLSLPAAEFPSVSAAFDAMCELTLLAMDNGATVEWLVIDGADRVVDYNDVADAAFDEWVGSLGDY